MKRKHKKLTKKEIKRQEQEYAQKKAAMEYFNRATFANYGGKQSIRNLLATYIKELPAGTIFTNAQIQRDTGLAPRQIVDAKRNRYIKWAFKAMQRVPDNPYAGWIKIQFR